MSPLPAAASPAAAAGARPPAPGARAAGDPKGGRLPIVDLVRLVSILAVFAPHLSVGLRPASPFFDDLWSHWAGNGSYGVTLFFVISGLVITRTILSRTPYLEAIDLRGFYLRRAGRILPLLVLVIAAGAVAMRLAPPSPARDWCLKNPSARFDAGFWAALATFSFNWLRIRREASAFGFGLQWDVLWSLAIEEQFYFCYPLLVRRLGTRRSLAFALAPVVAFGPLSRAVAMAVNPESFLLAFTNSFAAFEQLAMGALLALWLEREEAAPARAGRPWPGRLAGWGAAAGVAFVYWYSDLGKAPDRIWGPSAIAGCLTVFLAVGIRRGWFAWRWSRGLTWLGQLSYGGYLLHPLAIFALWPLLEPRSRWVGFPLVAATTLGAAALLHRFYEVPANRAIRRFWAAQ